MMRNSRPRERVVAERASDIRGGGMGWYVDMAKNLESTRQPASLVRLLLVDDHPVVRTALANLLSFEPGFEIVGQVDDGEAAVAACHAIAPDVCLLDITLPGIDGFETMSRIRDQTPSTRVLVLTSSDSHEDMQRAMDAGARGFMTKSVVYAELVAAIRTVHAGGMAVTERIAKAKPPAAPLKPYSPLTSRELEVLGLLRQGFTNADIGRLLGVSERTARAHVEAIKSKLHCNHRAEAVARGFELGLLKIDSQGGGR
jgi:DNA-binding NarL/FixJ family response regulator